MAIKEFPDDEGAVGFEDSRDFADRGSRCGNLAEDGHHVHRVEGVVVERKCRGVGLHGVDVGEIAAGALACDVVDHVGLDVDYVETAGVAQSTCHVHRLQPCSWTDFQYSLAGSWFELPLEMLVGQVWKFDVEKSALRVRVRCTIGQQCGYRKGDSEGSQ
ncbi:hypothetical protein M2284_002301 [Rhodococcus sp. LBL1]|nr:hypothetical protein [Rhodococcus sp. LBL1]MDH6683685.1 hypothetical protein [Rhodococcus sp. LBL2]